MINKILVGEDLGAYSVTNGARTITLTGLPFTPEIEQIAYVYNKTQDLLYYAPAPDLAKCTISGGVITIDSSFPVLATGDEVHIQLWYTPAMDWDQDAAKFINQAPDYAHYTDVEHLVDEEDLGLDGVHDGGDAAADFIDSSETYTAETVAEGYTIYNVTDGSDAAIDSGGAGNPSADDIAHAALANGTDNDWDDDDVASIPEVKRFEIPMDSYKFISIHYKLAANDEHNSCYLKVYGTNNDDADTEDDTDWVDLSVDFLTGMDGFDTDHVEADGIGDGAAATAEDIVILDGAKILSKLMIKIVAECDNGTQDNDFDVYIKKGY